MINNGSILREIANEADIGINNAAAVLLIISLENIATDTITRIIII